MADLQDVIERLKTEGLQTRNKGKNSIKSLREPLEEIVNNTRATVEALVGSDSLKNILAEDLEYKKQKDLEAADAATTAGRGSGSGGSGKLPGIIKGTSGLLGGLLGGLGSAAMGAGLGVMAAGTSAMAGALALFANPATAIGGAAVLTFLGGLAGITYLAGKGAQQVGKGIEDISVGVDALDEVGKKIDTDNLIKAGEGLKSFLENVGGVKSLFGAIITFLTGDLPDIADGMNKLNTLNIDKTKMTEAGEGLNALMSSMGEGSFFGKLMGSISTAIVPDLENLANGINKLSDVSKTLDLAKFKDMSAALESLHEPLYEFSKSAVVANAVGENAIKDIAAGITALNKTEVDRLQVVSDGMKTIDSAAFEIIKSGLVGNFVGSDSLKDISDGVSYLNKTEVDRMPIVAEGLKTIKDPLMSIMGIGLGANFVGKGAITDLTDAANDMNERLGSEETLTKAKIVSSVFKELSNGLSTWTGATFMESLSGVGKSILNFISGEDSPIVGILKLAERADDLISVSDSLKKISAALSSFANIKIDTDNVDFKKLAEKLGGAVPLMEGLAKGGKVDTSMFGSIDFGKGLLSPDLRLDEMTTAIQKVNNILGFKPSTEGAEMNVGSTSMADGRRVETTSSMAPVIAPQTNVDSSSTINNSINRPTPPSRPSQMRGGTYGAPRPA